MYSAHVVEIPKAVGGVFSCIFYMSRYVACYDTGATLSWRGKEGVTKSELHPRFWGKLRVLGFNVCGIKFAVAKD